MSAEGWEAQVAGMLREGRLSPLAAGILAALDLGIVGDSRSFAKVFAVAHALVLRECAELAEEGFLAITARDARSQRLTLRLLPKGRSLTRPDAD